MSIEVRTDRSSPIATLEGTLSVGKDERYWDELLDAMPWWDGGLKSRDVILLAPHPDDEVLGCSGLLQRCARSAERTELWMLTFGEGCFGAVQDPNCIAMARREEAEEAHRRLGLADRLHTLWLGLPDGHVDRNAQSLYDALNARVTSETTLIAPLAVDGHSDYDAAGQVAQRLFIEKGLSLVSYPVWLWHWANIETLQTIPGTACRLPLTAAEQLKKREAIAAFNSQIYSVNGDEAVLPRRVLRHFRRSFEVFFCQKRSAGHKEAIAATSARAGSPARVIRQFFRLRI